MLLIFYISSILIRAIYYKKSYKVHCRVSHHLQMYTSYNNTAHKCILLVEIVWWPVQYLIFCRFNSMYSIICLIYFGKIWFWVFLATFLTNYYVVNSDILCCHIIIKYNAHVCFCDGLMEYKNKENERELWCCNLHIHILSAKEKCKFDCECSTWGHIGVWNVINCD